MALRIPLIMAAGQSDRLLPQQAASHSTSTITSAPTSSVTEGIWCYRSRTPRVGIKQVVRCILPLLSTEQTFDEVVKKFVSSESRTCGPINHQASFKGRELFIFDPDGNETQVNTRNFTARPN